MTPTTRTRPYTSALGHLPEQPHAALSHGEVARRGPSIARDAIDLLTEKLRRAKLELETGPQARLPAHKLRRLDAEPSPCRSAACTRPRSPDVLAHCSRGPDGHKARAGSYRGKIASPRGNGLVVPLPSRATYGLGALQPREQVDHATPAARQERPGRRPRMS